MNFRNEFLAGMKSASVAVVACLMAYPSFAQWSVVDLHPSGSVDSRVYGTTPTHQAGQAFSHAAFWNGTAASWTDLNPVSATASVARAISGSQQVGNGSYPAGNRAIVWNGTPGSAVVLHPGGAINSDALSTNGAQQVGYVEYTLGAQRACLWNGTAASFVDLHPVGAATSYAFAATGSQQGGFVDVAAGGAYTPHAALWSGSAGSWADLNPPGSSESWILAMTPGQQIGYAAPGGAHHASIWSGTAASAIDVHPAAASSSTLLATTGMFQVGQWIDASGASFAGLWKGSSATFVDLHASLSGSYAQSVASTIAESSGNIVVGGVAYASFPGPGTAVIWTLPAFALTAATTGGGIGDVSLHLVGIRPTATEAWVLVSATPAPGGLGTGQFFGLFFPDAVLFLALAQPALPYSLIHFPVNANVYASGPVVGGAGTMSAFAGQTWDLAAVCFGPADGISGVTPVQRLAW